MLNYYDPLELATTTIYGETNEASIAWLRQAEIKVRELRMRRYTRYIAVESFRFVEREARAYDGVLYL